MARVKCPKCHYVNADDAESCAQCTAPLPRIRIEARPSPAPSAGPPAGFGTLTRGQVVAGRYTVLNIIGRGGMGCIYRAYDNVLAEEVALKTLLPQFSSDQLVLDRFFNEARITRRLSHPNVVRVHDIGKADNLIYISMELIEGKSLRALLEGLPKGQRMAYRDVSAIFDGLCHALEYAHGHTVHRDIKPENVMVDGRGRVVLMDFGISKLMANQAMTAASVVMGTPFYMAPEQLRNSRDVDARADIYSVGVMLYEVITGTMPTGVPRRASDMLKDAPPGIDEVIERCVDPEREKRYESARELRVALREVWERMTARPGKPAKRSARGGGGGGALARRVAGVALAGAALAAAALGVYGLELRAEAPAAAPVAEGSGGNAAASGPADGRALIAARIPGAQARAEGIAREQPDFADTVARGAELWAASESAAAAGEEEDALRLARGALQCFLAPALQPEGMAFVPPGETIADGGRVWADGFFMDVTEVTAGAFRAFAANTPEGWRVPDAMRQAPADWPMVMVAYFDAQAYAASKGKQLPTSVQWSRAAYGRERQAYPWGEEWAPEHCVCAGEASGALEPVGSRAEDAGRFGMLDLAGSVSEWTRTPFDGSGAAPGFGVALTVRGGNYQSSEVKLSERYRMAYEDRLEVVGFRCVIEFPEDPAALARLAGG